MERVMTRTDRWTTSAPRVEVDQRARETRLRLEHVERMLLGQRRSAFSRLWRVLCWLGSDTVRRERPQGHVTRTRTAQRQRRGIRLPIQGDREVNRFLATA